MYTSTSARTLYVCMCTFVFVFALYLCGARIVVMLASCDRAADLIWKQSLLLLVFALYTLFCAVLCCAVLCVCNDRDWPARSLVVTVGHGTGTLDSLRCYKHTHIALHNSAQ